MGQKIKILYAEDSSTDAELVLRGLKKEGFEHDCAVSAELSAIERLMKEGAFDVVLSDFNLKKFDARDVLKLRNTLIPETPFIVVTGTLSDEVAVELLKLGATDYVIKDRVSRLPQAVERALAEKTEKEKLDLARRDMEESEARYREIFSAASDIIFLVSLEGGITIANPSFSAQLGYPREKLAELKAGDLVPPHKKAEFLKTMADAAAGLKPSRFETVFHSMAGRALEVDGTFYPREKAGKVIYLQGIFRDLTEQRALEAKFRQAQKMEAVGRLAGGIAHDFNNILGAIEGYATLTLNSLKSDDPLRPDIEEIRKAVGKAAALTRQLLMFSRKQALRKQPCDPNEIVENIQKMITRIIGEDVKLRLDLQPRLPKLMADPGQLDQLLMNLLVNSRDAMPEGGTITLRTRLERVAPGAVKSPDHAEAGGEFVLLSVRDTGKGMNKETLEHIFEPFFTTKPRGKGTGLGLATAYGVVKQHNGWIEVESAEGQGAEFRVYLPVGPCPPSDASRPESRADAAVSGARVLVVEDDDNLRNLAVKALRGFGHRAEGAQSAAEALSLFRERGGKFDIVFSDIVLSDRKATEIVGDMLGTNPGVNFIFTSGYLEDKTNWDFINSRGYRFIQKPYSIETLIKAIEASLKTANAPG